MQCLKQRSERFPLAMIVALVFAMNVSAGEAILVSDAIELKSAERARPGDTILLSGGVWRDLRLKLRLKGTAERPITIRPADEGAVSIEGESALEFDGEHLVIAGLVFRNGTSPYGQILRVEGSNCRVSRCRILDFNPDDSNRKYDWISLHGRNHRVDHCRFSGQNHPGVTLAIWLASEADGRHTIERNHFGPRAPGNGNGFETIRIGDSSSTTISARCVVRNNLFEQCDGELETVSNKSCDNEYSGNTFSECAGTLTLRQGNDCLVRSNLFLGEGKQHTGGIRVMGEGHRIENNIFKQTDGRADGAIALSAGNENPKPHEYAAASNVEVVGNVFVGNQGDAITFTHNLGTRRRTVMPNKVRISGNQFVDVPESEVKGALGGELATWVDNRFGKGEATPMHLKPLTAADVGPGSNR